LDSFNYQKFIDVPYVVLEKKCVQTCEMKGLPGHVFFGAFFALLDFCDFLQVL
jgi:hypothetical protein